MNARLRIPQLFLLANLALTQSFVRAQNTNNNAPPPPPGYNSELKHYDIEIINGQLMLAPLKGHVDVKSIWGPGEPSSVAATIENLSKYLRAANPGLNIVLSPGAAEQKINDLKLRSEDMKAVAEAVNIATDGKVRGSALSGRDNWTFAAQPRRRPERTIEVFNLGQYLRAVGNTDEQNRKLDEIRALIIDTVERLQTDNDLIADRPQLSYHSGTGLLIVIGSPEAIDVARKIVNALTEEKKQADATKDLLDLARPQNQK